jgi:hypothetical protein
LCGFVSIPPNGVYLRRTIRIVKKELLRSAFDKIFTKYFEGILMQEREGTKQERKIEMSTAQ